MDQQPSQPPVPPQPPQPPTAPSVQSAPVPPALQPTATWQAGASPVGPQVQSPVTAPAAPPFAQTAPNYAPAPADNPGKTTGIVAIVMSILSLWPIGLVLSVLSIRKSSRAGASTILGIVAMVMNILAIIGSIIAIAILITAYGKIQEDGKNIVSQAQQQEAHSTTATAADVKIGETYRASPKGTFWAVGMPASNWNVESLDKNGQNVFDRADGHARFISFQGFHSSYAGSDDESASKSLITQYVTVVNGVQTGDYGSVSFKQVSDGKQVEFVTREYTFTNEKGNASRGIIAVRAFDGGHVLIANYVGTDSGYSSSDWDMWLEKLTINDGVL